LTRAASVISLLSGSLLCGLAAAQGQLLDRVAVSVDRQVITESAILLDRRVSAFLDGVPVDLSGAAKRKSAERLIDEMLILHEAAESRIALPTAKNAEAMLAQVKQQHGSDAAYEAALREHGVTEAEVSAHLLSGLVAYTFSELRFRPSLQISDDDIRAFYEKMKAPELIESPRSDIEEILLRQRTEEALDLWLKTARAAARIRYIDAVFQ
jgi:hypothetical protein